MRMPTIPVTRLFVLFCFAVDGDFLVYVDMHVRIASAQWSYVYAESFYAALASLFPQQVRTDTHCNEMLLVGGLTVQSLCT